MSGPPILDVRGLCVGIWSGKTELSAVADVSFRAYSGQVVALVGESGAGKSITAMSLTHLLPMPPIKITAGEIRLSGRDMQTQSPKQIRDIRGNEVGIVFQEPMTALNPSLRIWRQIAEPLVRHRRLSWSAAKAQAINLLKKVRIPDAETKAEAYPHQLSGGMRQRVMVAIAISCEPRLIIADEPTTALDVTVQAQILTLLTDLTRGLGGALLLITHDLGVVARYADWVNVMYAGRIVETAAADDLYRDGRHPCLRAQDRRSDRSSARVDRWAATRPLRRNRGLRLRTALPTSDRTVRRTPSA